MEWRTRSHYDVLGVPRDASGEEIRRAFRALALRYHPDVYGGHDAGGRFRQISDAYGVLHDPVTRALSRFEIGAALDTGLGRPINGTISDISVPSAPLLVDR
jgi:DnaJ-class molecular chaperone